MDYLIHHMLETSAQRLPEKEALVCGSVRLTYCEVSRRVGALARGLKEAGLDRHDRFGVLLDPSVEQAIAIFAGIKAGSVCVPMSPVLFPDQLGHIMADSEMTGLITTGARLRQLVSVLERVPSLAFVVVVGNSSPPDVPVSVHSYHDLTAPFDGESVPDLCIDRDLAMLLYTSGSTGNPKGVMLTHAQVMAGSSIVSNYLGITESERILAVLPFNFDAGLNQIMTAFQNGATIVMMCFTFAREIVEMLAEERITGLAGVPTLWTLLAQAQSSLHKIPLPRLRYITNTGGAMPEHVLRTLRRLLPATQIILMYGLTEAFRSTYLPAGELARRPTSIGKAIPNTEILVVDEDGLPCKPGEVGELVHRGPTVSLGYWRHPELTRGVLRSHPFLPAEVQDGEKVCYSGDLVKADEDGFLYFVGRRDTMMKSSGYRISPTEVEEILYRTGRVVSAAVVGLPDQVLGQYVKAFVVVNPDHPCDPEELIALCAERAPRHMIPREIDYLDELPKTASGKVDYHALRNSNGRSDLTKQQSL